MSILSKPFHTSHNRKRSMLLVDVQVTCTEYEFKLSIHIHHTYSPYNTWISITIIHTVLRKGSSTPYNVEPNSLLVTQTYTNRSIIKAIQYNNYTASITSASTSRDGRAKDKIKDLPLSAHYLTCESSKGFTIHDSVLKAVNPIRDSFPEQNPTRKKTWSRTMCIPSYAFVERNTKD